MKTHLPLAMLCKVLIVSLTLLAHTSGEREDDYRHHHHHHHHHNRHHRLRSYAKPLPWGISHESANSDRAPSSSSAYRNTDHSFPPSPGAPSSSSNSAICRREFLRPLEKRIADCETIFTGTVERIYRSQLSPEEATSPFAYLKPPVKPHSEALTSSVDNFHRPPEMMSSPSNLRRNTPFSVSTSTAPLSSEIQAEEPIESVPRESVKRVRTPANTRGQRIHPLLLAQYRQQREQEQRMRGFTRRNSLSSPPHQVARQRSQRAQTFTLDSQLAIGSSETYRALIRVKRIIKGDKSIQGKRIIIEGFGSDKICLSNVNERETKIFLTSSASALRMKLNSSLLSFTNENLRKCVVAVKAAVKMNRLSLERAVGSGQPLTGTTNGTTDEASYLAALATTGSTSSLNVRADATASTTVSTDHLVSRELQINKSTILITDESFKNLKSNLTDELLDDNHRHQVQQYHYYNDTGIVGGMTTSVQRVTSKETASSVTVDSDIDFLTDGDVMCPVKCNSIGSTVPISCDSLSRHCRCKPGVTGTQCDRCQLNYWGFHLIVDENGSCSPCNCNPDGSLQSACKQSTGQCECKAGVFGLKCDSCPPGKMLSESGCIPSVTDDYNRLTSSDLTSTSITNLTRTSLSNIDGDKLTAYENTVNVMHKKKRKKGLGKKKNRKKKKMSPEKQRGIQVSQ